MKTFKEWLLEHGGSTATRSRAGLYPELYTQIFNYCPNSIINWAADVITYMYPDDVDVKPILIGENLNLTSGEMAVQL